MQALKERFVTLSEAAEMLEERAKEQKGAPLSYEQQNTLEYCKKFGVLSEKQVKQMKKELLDTGVLSEKQVVKLIDLLPSKEDELKTILVGSGEIPAADKLKEILKICKSYKP
ncbi:MAG: hypothetical protein ACP5O3_02340 [Candidatus Micrarchaeia archaeon]